MRRRFTCLKLETGKSAAKNLNVPFWDICAQMSWVHETIYVYTHTGKQTYFLSMGVFVCVVKALRCLWTAGEIHSVRGHCQRLDAKGRSQPPARPDPSKLGRRDDFRGWDSVPGFHSEPTLKTDDARPQWPWRSNRVEMQAVKVSPCQCLIIDISSIASQFCQLSKRIYTSILLYPHLVSSDQSLFVLQSWWANCK